MAPKPKTISSLATDPKARNVDMSDVQITDILAKYDFLVGVLERSGISPKADMRREQFFNVMTTCGMSQSEVEFLYKDLDPLNHGAVSWDVLLHGVLGVAKYHEKIITIETDVRPVVHVRFMHAAECSSNASVQSWAGSSVTLKDGGAMTEYKFHESTISPDVSQEDAIEVLLNNPYTAWAQKMANCIYLFHGDPDVKRKTMLGSATSHCGLLPTTVHKYLEITERLMEARRGRWTLTASVLEFCDDQCFDVLLDHSPVLVGDDGMPTGATMTEIKTDSDFSACLVKLEACLEKRSSGSCSHVAVQLTNFYAVTDQAGLYVQAGDVYHGKTSFMFVDMANAQQSKFEGQIEASNVELDMIQKEAQKAASSSRQKPYKAPKKKDGASDFVRCMSSSLTGHTKLAVAVCLSQSSEIDWSSASSCSLGAAFDKLKVEIRMVKHAQYDKALEKLRTERDKAKEVFANTPKVGAKAPHWPLRRCQYESAAAAVKVLESIDPRKPRA